MKQRSLVPVVVSLIFVLSGFARAEEVARVEMFSPQGEVKGVRQVTVRFSEQMVSFGDPHLVEPFEAECPEKGRGRWADGRNWIYDFEKDLPAGIVCQFSVRPGLIALSGRPLTVERAFSFSTGGPAIRESYPEEGAPAIDEDQIFILSLDAEATDESVSRNVFCSIEGIHERVGVRLLKGDEKERILRLEQYRTFRDSPNVLLRCRQHFPNDSEVKLIWGKGVASRSGVGTTEEQVCVFKTRSAFTAAFRCDKENAKSDCIPVLPMRLQFSSPVSWEAAKKIVLQGRDKTYAPERKSSAESEEEGDDDEDENFVYDVFFTGHFPEKSSFIIQLPKDFTDDSGRALANSDMFPLTVRTDGYPPLAKFSSRFGILELKADAVLPVTVRNLESAVRTKMMKIDGKKEGGEYVEGIKGRLRKIPMGKDERIIQWLGKVAGAEREKSLLRGAAETKAFSLPKPGGSKAFEVVGIPLKNPGFYVVEMESAVLGTSLLGKQEPVYVPTAALVTNLSAHFKRGRESSLVWVTTLDKAEPVKDASVSIRDCKGKMIWQGKTDEDGIARIRITLPPDLNLPTCPTEVNYAEASHALRGLGRGLFVFAKTSDDMTFVHSSWDEGIEPWRYGLPDEYFSGPVTAHTVFDRTLLRAGQTVHMKHILRRHTMSGFSFVDDRDLPQKVAISHLGSDQQYEFPLKWDRKGIAETEWKIPADAKLGQYDVVLFRKAAGKSQKGTRVDGNDEGDRDKESPSEGRLRSGFLRVEEFRVPLMKGIIQPQREPLINAREAEVDLFVTYLSGGGASNAAVKLRGQIQPRYVHFEEYEHFVFANGEVREGVMRRSGYEEEGEKQAKAESRLPTLELLLDKAGSSRATIRNLLLPTMPQDLVSELEFRDPNGEIQTVSRKTPLWPSGLLVGIKPDSWALSGDSLRFQVVVLDLSGKPVADKDVKVDILRKKYYSHRKRLVGGFYSYEHVTEVKRLGDFCEGKTDVRGLLICEAKPPVSGNLLIRAKARDSAGNQSVANHEVWITGRDEWWFDVSNNDRIDLIPEKKRYNPGEKAKFQVRMPFRAATALITVEREGIMKTFVRKLSGKNPTTELPVEGKYAPNVFVSALVVRGRVSGVQPTAMVDLGKPSYKLGIAEINVGWKEHEFKVDVVPVKSVYKIREKAVVNIKVKRMDGNPPPKGSEAAIAAVDESLLELMPNKSWQLFGGMMGRRGYEVRTSTAQAQVVGKRHYGLKALPQGGGGGRQVTRELFDTLLLWKGRVPLDEKGEATVEIPLNDSLTGFRIVAVANGGKGFFGTGETTIRTTQDLMVLSGVPQLVREDDRFRAVFTVRNASTRKMDVEVRATIRDRESADLGPISESLSAGEAKEVGWTVQVPYGIDAMSYEITATEKGGEARDSLRVRQRVVEAVPVRTVQATIAQVDHDFHVDLEKPRDALSGRGGINLLFRPRLAAGLGGVVWYMKRYPYTCMEQKVSRAVALKDKSLWKAVTSELPSYLDADGFVKYFPAMLFGSDVLTSYMLSISHEAQWDIPAHVRGRMEDALKGFVEGKINRHSSLPTADLSIRKIAALEALSRTGAAEPKHLTSITLEPNLWPTSAVIDWLNILARVRDIPDREKRLREAEQLIRSRINFQGTAMSFSTERSDYLWWLMTSVDQNAVKSVLALMDFESWKVDMPRLVRGALGRQHGGAWDTTAANAWGVLAMERFSEKFEAAPVTGETSASLGEKRKAVDWGRSHEGDRLAFNWPTGKETLTISHQGSGRPWVTVQGLAAIPLKAPFSSGYMMKKTLIPVDRKYEGKWNRGDVVKISLELEAQADMTWVVVNDPVPAGSSILGTGLGRDSQALTKGEEEKGWVWPAFQERSFDSFRAYYEYVPKGKWTVEYTIRLNNSGSFHLPPTRVEALYAPEMFGEMPNGMMEVGE